MKKILLLSLLTAFIGNTAFAQAEKRCATDEFYQEAVKANPDVLRVQQQLEDFTASFSRNQAMQRTASGAPLYIIPLVFHILHNYGSENISDAQVIDAVRVINEDYSKMNSDTNQIIGPFLGIAADAQIEFRLANIDPFGNCTNGIDRIVTNLTYDANNDSKLNPWPNHKYINIWVAHDLLSTTAAAYAYLPGTTTNANDGIMAWNEYVGSIGTSTDNNKRTLTHELGHVLNLLHTWGSGSDVGTVCGDDFVSDTPITKGFSSCPTQSAARICNPPITENYQNFMDYSYCDVMFTEDQKTRMFATLNSGVSGRSNLWTNANLIATGTTGAPVNICAPNTDFSANRTEVCEGGTVTFSDISWNGKPTSWYWEFPGGTPSTSTDSMPMVTYNTAGIYDVLFSSSNTTGSDTLTRTNYVYVTGAPAIALNGPYTEDFELLSSVPGIDGYILNPDNSQTWTRITPTAYTGTGSIRINNYSNPAGQVDEWIMPSFDMSNITSPSMTFYYSHAQRSSTSEDELTIWGSTNCGQAWNKRWTRSGSSLATAGIISTNFIPSNAGQWALATIPIGTYASKPRVRFKFRNASNNGNNIYIDDINITGIYVNVDEIDAIDLGFALYPNPGTGNTKVQFKLSKTQPVNIQVTDLTGRVISTVLNETIQEGLHEYSIEVNTPGIYLINLLVNDKFHVRKLVVSE